MPPPRPQVIAHRGASHEAPENTLAAFRRALAIGVDGVELDVHLSADGVPVVLHDPLLGRTTSGRGRVDEHPLTALRQLDAGRWFGEAFAGERIPTLAEALDLLRPVRAIVEIKHGPIRSARIGERVLSVIRESGHPAVTVSCFDHVLLADLRRRAPALATAVLYTARPVDPVRLARDAGASMLHPHWAYLTEDAVTAAHAVGLRIEPWGVDEPEHLAAVVALGVDGVITGRPDHLRTVLAGLGSALPAPIGPLRSGGAQA